MTESEHRKYCAYLLEQLSAMDKMMVDILDELKELRKERESDTRNLYDALYALNSEALD